MTPIVWLVIFFLIALSALYVLAEFSSVSVRRSRLRQLAEEGNTLASSLLPIVEDARKLDQYIAACQIGITISSLGLGFYGQATLSVWLAPLFEHWGGLQAITAKSTSALVVLIGLTVLHMVLGELVPKSLALQYPTRSALYTLLPMRWSVKLFSWFIVVLNGSGIALIRLLGVSQPSHRHIHSPEEIELLIAESRDGGLLEPDEQRRLHSALRLGMLPVRQLMVPQRHVSAIDIGTPSDELLRKLIDSRYSRLPVYRDSPDNIIGMLHAKDLAMHYAEHGAITIEKLIRPITIIPENLTADRLLPLLRERRSQQAIVVDEFGRVEGLVTLEDVLAEVLGELSDEFKGGQPRPERLPEGRVRLPGLMRLYQAESWIGVLWEGESDTVGGRVIEALGHLPAVGEHVTIDGVDVEVEQIADHTVVSVLVSPVTPGEEREDG